MSEQGESGQATATAPSTPSGGMQANAESLVTPELESAFSAVFEGDGEAAGDGSGNTGPTAQERQREAEEAESLASLEGASEDDTGGEQFTSGQDEGGGEGEAAAEESERTSQGEQAGGQQDGSNQDSTLSPLLRHAAKRAGWTDEDIDQFHQTDPGLAERTFQRLHGSYSDLSAQYARLGQPPGGQQQPQMSPQAQGNGQQPAQGPQARQQTPQQGQQPPAQQRGIPQGQGEDLLRDLYGDQIDSFKEKYGEDFMQEVLQPMADRIVGPLQEMHQHYQQQQQEAVGKEVDSFFKAIPSELQELYGDDKKGPTDEQINARSELAQLADQIRSGAASQGVDMSVSEALERASTLHAHQHLEQIERKRLTDQVRKRSSKLTNRPSQRRTTGQSATSSGERSIQAAQEAFSERAAELGVDV